MEPRTLQFIAEACGGRLLSGSPEQPVTGVSTDSRTVRAGEVFVALKGERFDGHDFLRDAAGRGAAGLVVSRPVEPREFDGCAIVPVEDTLAALGRLGTRYRADFDLPVLAVGGSNGKTTTKELLATLLQQRFPALWSAESFNNSIGVPLTLLRLERTHRAAVLEVGTNHPGELRPLVEMIRPQLGIITSIGREHLEFFGDLAGVAREEGVLAGLLPAHGTLFVNGDTPLIDEVARRAAARVVRAGLATNLDWVASDIRLDAAGTTFRVESPYTVFGGEYRISLLGRHQVVNALLAMAAAAELGLSAEELRRGLAQCAPVKMRLQARELNGVLVLNDAYNANADSMLAALQTLRDLPCAGRRVAVLGEMAELGPHTGPANAEVGRQAASLGVSRLLTVGDRAAAIAAAARSAGLAEVRELADAEAAARELRGSVRAGDVVLVKASRRAQLERVVELWQAS